MKNEVLKYITNKSISSNNHCGTSLTELRTLLRCKFKDLRELNSILKELHSEKIIIGKKGVNQSLFFLNK